MFLDFLWFCFQPFETDVCGGAVGWGQEKLKVKFFDITDEFDR